MSIELSERVSKLVQEEVERCNRLPKPKSHSGSDTTADEYVNELIWLALRKGDISKGWK